MSGRFVLQKKRGEERKKEGIVSKVEHEKSFTKIPLEKKNLVST